MPGKMLARSKRLPPLFLRKIFCFFGKCRQCVLTSETFSFQLSSSLYENSSPAVHYWGQCVNCSRKHHLKSRRTVLSVCFANGIPHQGMFEFVCNKLWRLNLSADQIRGEIIPIFSPVRWLENNHSPVTVDTLHTGLAATTLAPKATIPLTLWERLLND